MEFQPIAPPQTLFPKGSVPPSRPFPGKKAALIAAGIVLVLIILLVSVSLFGGQTPGTEHIRRAILTIPILNRIVGSDSTPFLSTALPRPLEDLTLTDIPAYFDVTNAVQDGETIWFAGNGFILEYDIAKKMVTASTVKKTSGHCIDVVLAGGFLYAACDVRGIDQYKDAFKGFENSAHNYAVFKVDPKTRSTVKIVTPKDGLRGVVGYRLVADAADVWVTSQGGVGRILATGHVSFYDRELAIAGAAPTTGSVLIDGNHVWVTSLATTDSKGGISMFDKNSGTWLGFDPDNLQERERDKIDVEGLKTIPGGIQIAFRDGRISGTIRLVEKLYNYSSGSWTKINDMPTTGDGGIATYDYVQKTYPQPLVHTAIGTDGLSQLRLPSTGQTFPTNGRRSYILTPQHNGKRYLLTSATIDVLEDSSPFNRTLIKLGEGIQLHQSFPNPLQYQNLVQFPIEPERMRALVIDMACDTRIGCTDKQKVWLVGLTEGKLLRTYTAADGVPNGKLLSGVTLTSDGTTLTAHNKLGMKVFMINIATNHLTPFVSGSIAP